MCRTLYRPLTTTQPSDANETGRPARGCLSTNESRKEGKDTGMQAVQAAGRRNTKVPDSWSVPFRPPIHSCSTICRMDKETRKRKTTRSYSATRSIAEIQRQDYVRRESFANDYYLPAVEVDIFWQNLSRNRVSCRTT